MKNKAFILLFLICLTLGSCGKKMQTQMPDYIANPELSYESLNKALDDVAGFRAAGLRGRELSDSIRSVHRRLTASIPVVYDWWLQDGDTVFWFDRDMRANLELRNKAGAVTAGTAGNTDNTALFADYIDFCVKRRQERLAGFLADDPRVMFTKFSVWNPSSFTYTEGLSDARDHRVFNPGSELSTINFSEGNIWGREKVLIKDTAGMIRDPEIHFDGKKALFAWKKSDFEDDYHLYEMDIKSGRVRQITFGLGTADYEGKYLPDDNILFTSTRAGQCIACSFNDVSNLHVCDPDGNYIRRLGFDQVQTVGASLLSSGKVIYTRWDYNDRGQIFAQPLFEMNYDGTGQIAYYGMNSWFPTSTIHAREIPGTGKLMAVMVGHHTPQHGKLAIIDPEAGRDTLDGLTFIAPVRPPEVRVMDQYGRYGEQFQYPYPLTEREFLISYSPLGYYVGNPIRFGIYWMDVDGNRELLVSDASIACNQPVKIGKRQRPPIFTSSINYDKDYGTFILQDIYQGPSVAGIERGSIKKLRIVEMVIRSAGVGRVFNISQVGAGTSHTVSPVGVGNATWDIKKVHGTVDVNEDGSVIFNAPARIPLYFQALDSCNQVIQTMRSWATLQPGEMQSCVGCHENKNSVPVMATSFSMAMNDAGPVEITPYKGTGPETFSFQKEVQPLLDRYCISCHNGKKASNYSGEMVVVEPQSKRFYSKAYLNLTHARNLDKNNESWQGDNAHKEVNWISCMSEPTLLKPYSAGSATSNLIRRLEKGHGGTKLTSAEIDVFRLWIDLLVPFVGEYREANNWTAEELEYYNKYDEKRNRYQEEELASVKAYVEMLKSKK